MREFRKVWPRLVDHAERRGVHVAIENCPMIHRAWAGRSLASRVSARFAGIGSLSQFYKVGYDGVVSVEHEDRAFEGTLSSSNAAS